MMSGNYNTTIPNETNTKQYCDMYLTNNNLNPFHSDIDKKKIYKTLSHMMPTYTYDKNSNVQLQKACTLPDHITSLYSSSMSNTCSYTGNSGYIQLSTATNPQRDVQKGCVLSFYNDGVFDKTYANSSDIQNILQNAEQALNVGIYNKINDLRSNLAGLNSILNTLVNVDLPLATKKNTDIQREYYTNSNACHTNRINYDRELRIAADRNKDNILQAEQIEASNAIMKDRLWEKYNNHVVDKLIEIITILSYVEIYKDKDFGNSSIKITKNFNNSITRDNVFNYNSYANSRYDLSDVRILNNNFDNHASSIRVMKGMRAMLYEHFNFTGRIYDTAKDAGVSGSDYFNSRQTVKNFVDINFNDILSSVQLFGAYKTNVNIDEPQRFKYKLDNPPFGDTNAPPNNYSTNSFNKSSFEQLFPVPRYINPYKVSAVGGRGGSSFDFVCPNGSYVTHFNMRTGGWIDGMKVRCSDGTYSSFYGGRGGGDANYESSTGFTGLNAMGGGTYVDKLEFYNPSYIGTTGANHAGGKKMESLNCGTDGKIVGIHGKSGAYIDSFGVHCSKTKQYV